MDLLESMQQWPDKWRREGEQRGFEQAHRVGERMVRAQVEFRFGAELAARAEPLLHAIADEGRLTDAAKLVVSERTGDALVVRLALLARRSP